MVRCLPTQARLCGNRRLVKTSATPCEFPMRTQYSALVRGLMALIVVRSVLASGAATSRAEEALEPVTWENAVAPAANTADEPVATGFSLARAVHFLDSASLTWQKEKKCMTCHTNYLYLLARPAVDADVAAHDTVRRFAEQLVTERWPDQGPRWDAEVVMTAVMLALNDRATTGQLHPVTRQALDRIWTVQRENGGFNWLKCDWPPMEDDDHFGATMAAIGVGAAPANYADSQAARGGLEKLRGYLLREPQPTLHHELMLVWASNELDGLLSPSKRQETLAKLWPLQHADGGWGIAQLGPWPREDGSAQDLESSDGYGTGLAVFLARQCGVAADDQRLQNAVGWLKTHQRASGRWFTRSVHADGEHFITHAGTALAVLAIRACDTDERAAAP